MFNEISSELITSTKDDLITTGNVNYKINIRALGIISTVLQLPFENHSALQQSYDPFIDMWRVQHYLGQLLFCLPIGRTTTLATSTDLGVIGFTKCHRQLRPSDLTSVRSRTAIDNFLSNKSNILCGNMLRELNEVK
ncbi:uncharacterized protein LOC120778936 isoform X1 [Bactrocera tryoni]|uniref:uncharacterized protein LOC120778936 isoform X1 n=1 Tax=Bactrocera tryoni TaxID=59916 RepID=UPI001A99305B|nr:uncharacterized protein LOC120778936 isoform X1 [Bactrocera tryoni]